MGAAFAVVAISGARGIFYVVVAIIAAAGYSVIHHLTRSAGAPVPAERGD